MAIENTRYTPKRRGPSLNDGLGGSSERPSAQVSDRVLRVVGHRTEDIRLTPTGTDVSAGVGALYDFGAVSKSAVGTYMVTRQGAASAAAEPLGALEHVEFILSEATAGVFTAVTRLDDEGGTATNDADDPSASDATMTAVADAALDGTGSDSRATVFVATAADVVDAAAWTAAATLVAGHLYVLDAVAAATHVFTAQRLTG